MDRASLSITDDTQRNTIFFIAVKVLHVSGGFPAHHQELKNCTYNIWYLLSLVVATAGYGATGCPSSSYRTHTHTFTTGSKITPPTKHTTNICETLRIISVSTALYSLMMDRIRSETCWSDF